MGGLPSGYDEVGTLARQVNRLTDRESRGVKAAGYHLDGDGLYLQIAKTGGRSWIYRFSFGGRRREMGLGSLQDVTLAKARGLRDEAKRLVSQGEDPLVGRKPASTISDVTKMTTAPRIAGIKTPPTLGEVWTEYVEAQKPAWRGRKTVAGWMRSIEKHAASIKGKPISEIDVDDVLMVLQPLWMTKAESAGKLRERLERVVDYAKVKKLRSGENPAT